jgi:hypothetical protein
MFASLACLFAQQRLRRSERFFQGLAEGDWISWTLLILGIVGLLWLALDSFRKRSATATLAATQAPAETVACPRCGARVRRDTAFCRSCKEWVDHVQ